MKYSFWHQIPIVRLLLPFAAGIGISMFYPLGIELASALFGCLLLVSIFIYNRFQGYAHGWLFGGSVLMCVFFGGFTLHAWQLDTTSIFHYQQFKNSKYAIVMVNEQPIAKTSSYKMKCKVVTVVDSLYNNHFASGELVMYVEKTPSFKLTFGDVLLAPYAHIKPVSPPQNPDEFDYKRYLAFNNIFDQVYCKEGSFIQLGLNNGNQLRKWVYQVQNYFKSVLTRCIGSANEIGVAEALLYGFDDDIDAETVQAYSNTGTLHVLAVSGMHVGIIFMILGLVLKPLDKQKQLRLFKNIIILVALWLYSLLCGLSPSILRATVMFSFIIFSSILNIRSNVYNTLAASAFVLLCADSNLLANVGFQLSYLAVLGIVFFQPYVYSWFFPSNWLVDEIWKITSISIAAQLTTFPIGLLYFHQFPNCFLVSNLLIIPLTTLILYMAILLLVIVKFSWLSWLLGQALYYTIGFTNAIVLFVERIPYSYVNGIHISIPQSILLYIMLGLFTAFFLLRRTFYLKLFLIASILFFMVEGFQKVINYTQNRLVVYAVRNATVVQVMRGNNATLFGDSLFMNNKDKMKFHLQQHTWKSGIEESQQVYLDSSWKQINIDEYSMVISGNSGDVTSVGKCELLLVRSELNLTQLDSINFPKRVIITGAVKHGKAMSIREYFKRKNIPVQYIGETGSIEVSLPN